MALILCTHTCSVLTAIFPGEPGLAGCPLILLLHLFLDCASFWDRPKLSMSFLTQSHWVFFGHPLCLIPSTSHVIRLTSHYLFVQYVQTISTYFFSFLALILCIYDNNNNNFSTTADSLVLGITGLVALAVMNSHYYQTLVLNFEVTMG